ncbi:MAG: hypothetical protein AAFO04_15585 [Cyanobacteria bacterium J06592_8]
MKYNFLRTAVLLLVVTNFSGFGCSSEVSRQEKAQEIHDRILTIDSHVD